MTQPFFSTFKLALLTFANGQKHTSSGQLKTMLQRSFIITVGSLDAVVNLGSTKVVSHGTHFHLTFATCRCPYMEFIRKLAIC